MTIPLYVPSGCAPRAKKLDNHLWRSAVRSWVPLGETAPIPRMVQLISSYFLPKSYVKLKKAKTKLINV